MQYTKNSKKQYVIRIARGEEIVSSLASFCRKNKIYGGFFFGLGAVDRVNVAHYNVETKKYSSQKFDHAFEVTNISGSVGVDGETDDIIVHAHISLTDTDMKAFGGHLVEARVSGTVELILMQADKLLKKKDEDTGLKLFNLDQTS